jgi:hypothetical protein
VSIGPRTTRTELAARVSRALAAAGIDATLVGGAVAAIYSRGKYLTDDVDIVSHARLKEIAPILQKLGFEMIGNRAVHPRTALYVQFCSPPLSVGHSPVKPIVLKTPHGTVATLSPTDCVLDRLMKFYHWDDEQGLEQALLVARSRRIDLERIREVSLREGKSAQLRRFITELRRKR